MSSDIAVIHEGRGGRVEYRTEAGTIVLVIEMGQAGRFSVWLRGAQVVAASGASRPLRAGERAAVRAELRDWLDHAGRGDWRIEE